MMDTALNRAHQLERKADLLFRSKKFDEAIECHESSAELLKEAMQLTSVSQALESLQLQYNYQINRKKIIRYKQNLLGKLKTLNKQMAKLALKEAVVKHRKDEDDVTLSEVSHSQMNEIKRAIYKNIDENDSLLKGLCSGGFDIPLSQELLCANIIPQDDKMIIEELKINNAELREFVDQLSIQLENSRLENHALKRENELLRRQLHNYEMERSKPHTTTGSSSPFIYSPSGDLSPEIFHTLPQLPPLEMPDFDFNRFSSSTEENSTENEISNQENYKSD